MREISRKSAVMGIALAAIATLGANGPAVADDGQDSPEVVTIGDRTYGPGDGLVIESGEVTLGRARPRTFTTMAAKVYSRGTSYASSDHPTFISYVGEARAMANIYDNLRVIRASFKYTRDGNDVISWQHSSATGCWSPGSRKSHTVFDSLLPNAPVTRFRYDFVLVNPSVC